VKSPYFQLRISYGYKLRSITSGRLRQRQIKSAALTQVDLNPAAEDWSDEGWTDEEWTKLSLQGLSRAYGDDEPDYELLETKEFQV
jgi:hypothetical protein